MRMLLLLAWLALGLASCTPRMIEATAEERQESFAAYREAKIGKEPTASYLGMRTAFLLRSEDVEVTRTSPVSGSITFLKGGTIDVGTATAIDRRGYFLTAAHCVAEGPPILFFYAQGAGQFDRGRIVWRGQPEKGEPDLALLHVPFRLDHVFRWAADFGRGDPVLTAGYYGREDGGYGAEHMAGKILKFSRDGTRERPFSTVYFDVPVARGNSGGPAMTPGGRLVAINVALHGDFHFRDLAFRQWGGSAERPEPAWLRALIEDDQSAGAEAASVSAER